MAENTVESIHSNSPQPPDLVHGHAVLGLQKRVRRLHSRPLMILSPFLLGPVGPELPVHPQHSLTLVALLVFIELTNPAFGNLGQRLKGLRDRYSLLTANLLLVFLGLVLTRVVIILSG